MSADGRWRTTVAAVTTLTVLIVVGLFSATALAATTLQVALQTATPEQNLPVVLGYSGSNDSSGDQVFSVVRPAGAVPCADSYQNDLNAAGNADYVLTTDSQPLGAFTFTRSYQPPEPGGYIVCSWTENGSTVLAGPITTPFTARGPQASLSVALPLAPVHDREFQIQYTVQTDQNLSLYSVIKPAGATPCAANYSLELDQDGDASTVVVSGNTVYGGPTGSTGSATEPSGSYLICSWVEGPDPHEVDAAVSTPVTIPAPPPKPRHPGLRITHATLSHKHGATVRGTTSPSLTGRVEVFVACGKGSTSTVPRINDGRFNGHLRLPRSCRRARSAKVGVVWAGSPTFARQTLIKQFRIHP